MSSYRTVAGEGESRVEVNGSTFLGFVTPADSVEAAEAFVASVNEAYPDGRHVVPAYRVPAEGSTPAAGRLREWCSDDGEPSGSSGDPALNVLVQRDLRNVASAVVRYKNGPNLGVGGLARSYSRAVTAAVDDAGVVEERPHERVTVTVDYDDSGTARGIVESEGLEFEATYEERVSFEVRVPVAEADALRDRLRSATGGRVDLS
jgi:putative IMPACT (imprinted ancient) family translation regulator